MGKDQRYYNINKLNVIFAIAACTLLFALISLFANDYSRKWKDYQKEFHLLEIENARTKYDAVMNQLDGNEEYQTLLKELDEAEKGHAEKCGAIAHSEELTQLQAENDLVQQNYKFRKAELDAAKYRFEATEAHPAYGQDLEATKQEFLTLEKQVDDLQLKLESSNTRLTQKKKEIDACSDELKKLDRQRYELAKQKELIERKLKNIDPNAMDFTNQVAQMVRDLPVLDLANPNYKIEQIVLKDIRDDVNFMTVPKVERCMTCHLGISNPDYKNAAQPYKTHPNLDLFIDKNSPHPLEEFGCTVCHGGRGRGTDFISTAHTPSSDTQKKEWEEKYDWHELKLWEEPMLPKQYTEAGCFKCHSGETAIKGADKLNLGLQVIQRAGCYNCHQIDQFKGWPKSGPSLRMVKSKLSKDWIYKWIEDPKSFRHNTWMPTYFNQSNNDDPESVKRSEQEILAITHYLYTESEEFTADKMRAKGSADRGKELVASVGCMACHNVQPQSIAEKTTKDTLRREHGPNLIGLGSKVSKEWIYSWLKDPNRYHPTTRMPNLRLSDQEAADIAEYLYTSRNEKFEAKKIPAVDQKVLGDIVLGYLTSMDTHAVSEEKLAAMTQDEQLYFAGQKLINRYGCFSCHDIKGFDKAKPIGTELTEIGNKSTHKLDFGFVHIDHSKWGWFSQKLKDPRIFDEGKEKAPDEKLIMPNFYLSQEEVEAAVTVLLGLVNEQPVEAKKVPRTPENLQFEAGQKLIAQMNCQSCHQIQGEGGTIQKTITDWLVEYEGRAASDAEKVTSSFSPPNLKGVGQKVDPNWLFNFLHQPTDHMRPWLNVRMPTYNFNAEHLNMLVKYFHTIDEEKFPFNFEADTSLTDKEYKAAEKLFSKDYLGCAQCHVVGDQMPYGEADAWAPNLALAKTRLNPHWVLKWIKNPQDLVPGTKMPTFFDPSDFENAGPPDILDGDENEQIRVLRNYLFHLSEVSPKAKTVSVTPAEPAPAATATEETQ
ncbi:MAG: c-type cytochrome [Candidatus Omnitrophica bacterium]|nr:c-type cytochrome [Candidatus Omnitrophota bacterium]